MPTIELEKWSPMPWQKGPPLPSSWGIYWPWYKAGAAPPGEQPPVTPTPPAKGNILGRVTDQSNNPLPDAKVSSDSLKATTNANGEYAFNNIDPGSYVLKFEKSGYQSVSKEVNLTEGQTVSINATLNKLAGPFNMQITSINIRANYAGTMHVYDINCAISNPNNVAVSRKLSLKWVLASTLPDMYRNRAPTDPSFYPNSRIWERLDMSGKTELDVTLAPGASQPLTSPGVWLFYDQGPYQKYDPGAENTWYYIIVDDLGNVSPPSSITDYG